MSWLMSLLSRSLFPLWPWFKSLTFTRLFRKLERSLLPQDAAWKAAWSCSVYLHIRVGWCIICCMVENLIGSEVMYIGALQKEGQVHPKSKSDAVLLETFGILHVLLYCATSTPGCKTYWHHPLPNENTTGFLIHISDPCWDVILIN